MKDYYKILSVSKNSSQEEIKKSYRKLALQYHPDRNNDPSADSIIKDINEAYDVLGDEVRRANYNFKLEYKTVNPRPSNTYRRSTSTTQRTKPFQKKYYQKKKSVFNFKDWAHKAKFVSAFILLYCGILSLDYFLASEYSDITVDYLEMTYHRSGRRTSAPERDYYIESPNLKFSATIEMLTINKNDTLDVSITPIFGIVKKCFVKRNENYQILDVVNIYSGLFFFVLVAMLFAGLSHLTKSNEESVSFTFASGFFFIIILFI
jgi:hypothetical protein